MKLSDAIREGCRQSNAHVGSYLIGMPGDSFFGACALGAAALGAGIDEADIHGSTLCTEWPELTHWTECPECGAEDELFNVVSHHLNDDHRWTREGIADFIDAQTIELPATVRTAVPA
jgi:rubredoxin